MIIFLSRRSVGRRRRHSMNDYLQQQSTLTLGNNKLRRISLIEMESAANDAVLSRRIALGHELQHFLT